MRVNSLLGLVIGTIFMNGCAGPRYAQAINRLKADVGLLDQRISQLERASFKPTQQPWPAESWRRPASPVTRTATSLSTQPSAKAVQRALKNAGFDPGPIDGKLGSRTRQAVREFQGVNGLQVDGIVGKRTWARLAPSLDLEASDDNAWAARPAK